MIALIDGDIILYRIGYTTENESEDIARVRADDLLDSILLETGAKEFEVWLSDKTENGFRYELYPQYKANRTQPRPKHYEAIKEFLVTEWGARIAVGMEADDALGIAQNSNSHNGLFQPQLDPKRSVICSIDKDLLQIPGQHYNFVRKEWSLINRWEGLQWFYKQILIGDTVDNVQGCKGIGPVKAGKAIDQIRQDRGERALFESVVQTYEKQETEATRQEILDHILLVGRLLKIKQTEDEGLWEFPSPESLPTTAKPQLSSTLLTQEAATRSTEPTAPSTSGFQPVGPEKVATSTERPTASTLRGQ